MTCIDMAATARYCIDMTMNEQPTARLFTERGHWTWTCTCGRTASERESISEYPGMARESLSRHLGMTGHKEATSTLSQENIKGSPEYSVTDPAGRRIAYAHCVNVPANLFTLVIGGKWSGVLPEADAVKRLQSMCS